MRPPRIRITRPISGTRSSTWCVTSRMPVPCCASRRIVSRNSRCARRSSAFPGSSSSSTRRPLPSPLAASARAINTRFCCPALISPSGRRSSSAAPTARSTSHARSRISAVGCKCGQSRADEKNPVSTTSSPGTLNASRTGGSAATTPSMRRNCVTSHRSRPKIRTRDPGRTTGYSSHVSV